MFQPPLDDANADFEFHRGPLKRFHEEEAAPLGFTEHRNKRLQTLPLRTSPTSQKWSSPSEHGQQQQEPTMTPPGSFSEDPATVRLQQEQQAAHELQQQRQHLLFQQQQQQPQQPQHGITSTVVEPADMDMDMATDSDYPTYTGTPLGSGHHLAPGPQQPDQDSVVAGRMPTPIQPNFSAQVRGNNWGGAAGNLMHTNPDVHSMQEMAAARDADIHGSDRSVPRSLDHPATTLGNWSMVHNRSLPSPISETGGEEAGRHRDTGMADREHDLELEHEHYHEHELDHDHEHLDHDHSHLDATPARASSAMHMHSSPGGPTPADAAFSSPIRGCGSMDDGDPAATPSPRKGHSRSRHTIVQWTAQPGMKKSFSIGYRADCEKCRNRVPGHFNHIIVS